MKPIRLKLPLQPAEIKRLKPGQYVYLSGKVHTARDAAHRKIVEALDRGMKLPFDLQDAAIYYVGPAPCPPDRVIGPCGPTTSYRMDKYAPRLMQEGVRVMIGKGERNEQVIDMIKKTGSVYFVTIGGIATLLAERVISNRLVAFPELGPEAVRELEIVDFPCFVKNN
jgi:fumarate hydratase subunit beta